jgi:predicted ATPase
MAAKITELRLTAFKSFRDARLEIGNSTLLIGRNSTGKSNALDALEVLARIASGGELSQVLDGRGPGSAAVRGGSTGLPPHGADAFEVGCTVEDDWIEYHYDVAVTVSPDLYVSSERLVGPGMTVRSGKRVPGAELFTTQHDRAPGIGIETFVYSGKQGPNPPVTLRDSRSVLGQVPLALPQNDNAQRSVVRAAEAVQQALQGVFHLDPVPSVMRDYVPARSEALERNGENLSAVLHSLHENEPAIFAQIEDLVRAVADDHVIGLDFETTSRGEFMVALKEQSPDGRIERTPARQMSDGLLRFAAVATALLQQNHRLDVPPSKLSYLGEEAPDQNVLLVIEELENGLHPSQADRVLSLVKEAGARSDTQVLATTHSPALLDAVEGRLNDSVVVCHRNAESGTSALTPLEDFPEYTTILAEGTLGDAIARGRLDEPTEPERDFSDFEKLIGLR